MTAPTPRHVLDAMIRRLRAVENARATAAAARISLTAEEVPPRWVDGVSIHEDVRLAPLHPTLEGDAADVQWTGGLLDRGGTLIPQANHYGGRAYRQAAPHARDLEWTAARRVRRSALYAGPCFTHFGHFMAESLSRLWAYRVYQGTDPVVLYALPRRRPSWRAGDGFVFDVLRGFEIPSDRVLFAEQPLVLDRVIVPEQRYGFGRLDAPDETFVAFLRTFRYRTQLPHDLRDARHVYVSRSGFGGRGRVSGETRFEEHLANQGYTVFRPESHRLAVQLSVYAHAERIVFAEGSALLACVLLPDLRAQVAVIARRRDPVLRSRSLVDCLTGFGRPPLWIDHVVRQYQFGLPTWDALAELDWHAVNDDLRQAGFVSSDLPEDWAQGQDSVLDEDISLFIRRVSSYDAVRRYLRERGEDVSAWHPPSHFVDPRSTTFPIERSS